MANLATPRTPPHNTIEEYFTPMLLGLSLEVKRISIEQGFYINVANNNKQTLKKIRLIFLVLSKKSCPSLYGVSLYSITHGQISEAHIMYGTKCFNFVSDMVKRLKKVKLIYFPL